MNESGRATTPWQLFATGHSLYSGKARAYLRYKGVPFEEVYASLEVIDRHLIDHLRDREINLPVVAAMLLASFSPRPFHQNATHGFGCCRTFIQQRGIGYWQPRQITDHRLEIQ